MNENNDFIRELGLLALGSRLRRFNDRLNRDVARIYKELDIEFDPHWFPVLYFLKTKAPTPVMEIAAALNYTHPNIIHIARLMTKRGLITSKKDKSDERKRLLALTSKGINLAKKLEPIWNKIAKTAGALLDEAEYNLLDLIDEIESLLDKEEFYDRYKKYSGH
ncbi:MAG: MarR family transcriptional regulator [Candidatus Zixiibacteriota bacterium]